MANTLTGLIPTIYAGLDIVSRELIGFIPNVTRDVTDNMGAVGQVVRSPVVPSITLENITAGAVPANSGDATIGTIDVTITKSRAAPIRWNGEEQLGVGTGVSSILANQFAQAFRALANEIEADIGSLYTAAGRAYGTPATAPFGTANNMTDLAQCQAILDVNGAPAIGRKLIIGSAARANLEGTQSQLFKVNEAGTDALLRQRSMRELLGFDLGYSAGVRAHTTSTAASYLVNDAAGIVIGATSVAIDTGTGAFVAGDVVNYGSATQKYVVGATSATPLIQNIGAVAAVADNAAINKAASYTANMFFSQGAIVLASRVPAMPIGGDSASDVTLVTDPVSGLTFQVAEYRQYRQVKFEVSLAWGVKVVKPEHLGILMG